ncbi:hypothetical protein Barb7_00041 [Bacteroidales bacterium Barb7]|nr:hypothetical protein Barb7_00058 [Bacteroidales bacterium Barb7]OAV76293.1 hypothetical protein Barb7_00007 [Bacteroidales bacterium Barb7]OAV76327.1 hypothetical protein Barb7_00041 [Bacteroidales bacterium Barb7]
MKKYSWPVVLGAFCVLLFSCYRDIDLESYRGEPTLVLNSVVSPSGTVRASLSRTWFFTDGKTDTSLGDAKVELYINGGFAEEMVSHPERAGMYVSSIVPHPGESVKIIATTIYGTVWAEDTVPFAAGIEETALGVRKYDDGSRIITQDGSSEVNHAVEVTYGITFEEIPGEADYYLIRISDSENSLLSGTLDYSSDPVFIDQFPQLGGALGNRKIGGQGGRVFSDAAIEGKRYTLTVKETAYASDFASESSFDRRISLYALSKPYYLYFLSLQSMEDGLMQDMVDLGFTEPRRVYSNVEGGTGILGASERFEVEVSLRNIIEALL